MPSVREPEGWVARLRPQGYGAPWAYASLVVLPAVLGLCAATIGLRPEHFVIAFVFVALAWAGPRARRFSFLAAPFVVTGIAYDLLRLFMKYRGEVHTGDLFDAERALFPVHTAAGVVSLSEVIARATHPGLDLLTGVLYITYLVEVFGVGALLYLRRDEPRMARLAFGFALASVMGWVVWIVWPAAPPWYIDMYGPGPAILSAPPSPAGAARFDAIVGTPLFASFYARSSNVFGAMPSLHAGYAILTAIVTFSAGGWLRRFTITYAALMAFAAVYLRHHYLLDVLAGALVALVADALVLFASRGASRVSAKSSADEAAEVTREAA